MSGDVRASVPYFLAERTIDQLRASAESDRPFFISTCFWGPHAPYVPCEPYASMYDPSTIEPWGNFEDTFENKPEIYRRYRDSFIGRDGQLRTWEQCAMWAALYFGFTTQIDEQCGRIIAALDEFGLAENTIVMFTTDHGDLCGAHGGMHDKTSIMVQELFHIPLVVHSPFGGLSGERCSAPVSSIDLSATICDAAGCDAPELDGRSLLPLLDEQAPPEDWPDHVVAMDFGIHFNHDTRMIVSGRMKYIFRPSDIDELYDLEADPWEMRNLINDPAFQHTANTMRDKLIAWCAENDDPLLPVLRNFYSDRSVCTIENAQPYRMQTHQL